MTVYGAEMSFPGTVDHFRTVEVAIKPKESIFMYGDFIICNVRE